MRGLNESFKEDPVAFLGQTLLVTRRGEDCPTCHRPIQLNEGFAGHYNAYVRPEPVIMTFDLIGGAYAGGINAGEDLLTMLEGDGALIPAQPAAAGLAPGNPLLKYATLLPMTMGAARDHRRAGYWTHKYTAYWLPWTDLDAYEHQLTDPSVRFFFTAMFSGCTFAVAVPAAGQANVWVTHIAWDPGAAALAGWGGGAYGGGNADARRLEAEEAFFQARLGAGQPVRSVTSEDDPLVSGALGLGAPGLPSGLIANGAAVPPGSQRIRYGADGQAFVVGWRDRANDWHFAVQRHPIGRFGHGDPAGGANAAVLPVAVAPVAVQQIL